MDILDEIEREVARTELMNDMTEGMTAPKSTATLTAAAREIKRQRKALETLAKYFTSGNCIPVDQATIKAADFWNITGMTVPNAPELTGRGSEAHEGPR